MGLMDQLKSLFRRSDEPPATRRLDGRSKELLAASIKMIPYEERGWISLREATILFSPEDDEYAFRETDRGTRNLASFVADETRGCRFAFIEGQLYFMRIMSDSPEIRASFDERAVRKDRRPWSEAIRQMINQVPPYWRTFLQRAKKIKSRLPAMSNWWSKFLLTLKYHVRRLLARSVRR